MLRPPECEKQMGSLRLGKLLERCIGKVVRSSNS